MPEFIKFFLQFIVVNGIYGALFGRPDKFGVRGLYLDEDSLIGGENASLLPSFAPHKANKFFKHTLTPYPEYDFIMIDCHDGYFPAKNKFKQGCKRLIPGGYLVLRNTKCSPDISIFLMQEIKNNPDYDVLEFTDGEGIALVRVREKAKFFNHKVKPLNAGFWIAAGILGGVVAGEFFRKRKEG